MLLTEGKRKTTSRMNRERGTKDLVELKTGKHFNGKKMGGVSRKKWKLYREADRVQFRT